MINSVGSCILSWFDLVLYAFWCFGGIDCGCGCARFGLLACAVRVLRELWFGVYLLFAVCIDGVKLVVLDV